MATPEVEHGQDALKEYNSKGPRKVPLLTLFKLSINIATGDLGLQYGLRGPTITMTAADSSSAYSVGNAFRIIRDGCADFMLTGGSEMRLTPSIIGLINRSVPLSAKFNDFPETSSRPFDRDRDGLVLAEGSAMLTLEEYEKAKARGAHIYCEVIGFGMSGDGRNLLGTAPPQDGKEAYRAMAAALKDAKEKPEAVRYVNAHAVSSRLGDAAENQAIVKLLGSSKHHLAVSSIKGATGTIIGAAGSLDAAITALALQNRELPPTLNLYNLDSLREFPLNYVSREAQQLSSDGQPVALSNSFGLAGSNACLCFRAI
jgi:3-oxoacyl-[acyl-carrier-protein] synthase II